MNPPTLDSQRADHYRTAMVAVHKQLQQPAVQRGIFSIARTSPTDLVRSKLSRTEIQHRALTSLSDEMLANIPYVENSFSLFQGFQASFPDMTDDGKKHRRKPSRGRKMLDEGAHDPASPEGLSRLRREKATMMHELQLLMIRKNMASCEIRDIDNKLANLSGMRRTVLDRMADIEQDEAVLEQDSEFALVLFLLRVLTAAQSWIWRLVWRRRSSPSMRGRKRRAASPQRTTRTTAW